MSLQVTLKPSGHQFNVEFGETLLEAALRSGISLEYNCNNGTCGKCQASLVDGEIAETLHSDFVFKNTGKVEKQILLCRCKPATDLILEAREASNADEIPEQSIQTQVYRIEEASGDIRLLQLRTPRSQSLQFLAGQHVRLKVEGLPARHKSIASCPCNGMYLQFHFRNNPDNEFSNYIFNQVKTKSKITVTGPYGGFHLDEDSPRTIIFIAYETGFAPIKSLVEHALAREMSQDIHLYWLSRTNTPHYLENYCRAWSDAEDNFHYHSVTLATDVDAQIPQQLEHWGDSLLDKHPVLSDCDIYINGPDEKFKRLSDKLIENGLPRAQLQIDNMQRY
ncbi:hypothetical protein MNBD_GAMMA25-1396 [hydrothermal vent metagenome]|uniref:2-polyprenylphenol hydroxylase and related flavodoxin oxidoreductases / CDP-6-deoxy-delta-3,4-glucoseen reductase-like n=1 Tax=hydrothermal vent metagenome TaxID=652676 RepID=A0A3B1AWQ7_9ZZZZ